MEKLTAVGFAQLWKEAEQGNAQAQFMLAGALYNGNGRQRDPIEGARWFLRAAEQGYAPAQCDLGVMYLKGAGVKQDYGEAMKWLKKAAKQNDALAQHSLGSVYAKGFRDKSVGFFGRIYGAGLTRDYVEAYKWFTLAAKNGYSQSLRDRAFIAKMWMKPHEIERAERLAREFETPDVKPDISTTKPALDAVADYGAVMEAQGSAMLDVSRLPLPKEQMKIALREAWRVAPNDQMREFVKVAYFHLAEFQAGIGDVPVDCALPKNSELKRGGPILDRYLMWSKLAAAERQQLASEWDDFVNAHIGKLISSADQCVRENDHARAVYWYDKAANLGDTRAQTQLARMYAGGVGVAKNDSQAATWSRLAAEQGSADAQALLADFYVKGWGVPVDHEQAALWSRRGAEQGNATAQMLLGALYHNGQGVPKDYVKALALLNQAVANFTTKGDHAAEKAKSLRDYVATRMTPAQIAQAKGAAQNGV